MNDIHGPHISLYPGECSISKVMVKESVLDVSKTNIMHMSKAFSGFKYPTGYESGYLYFDYIDNHGTIFFSNESEFKPYKYIATEDLIVDPDVLSTKITTGVVFTKYTGDVLVDGKTLTQNNLYVGKVVPTTMNTILLPNTALSSVRQQELMNLTTEQYNGNWYVYPNYQDNCIEIYVDFTDTGTPESINGTFEYIELLIESHNNVDYSIICDCYSIEYNLSYDKYVYYVHVNCISSSDDLITYHYITFYPVSKYQTFTVDTYTSFASVTEQLKFKLPFHLSNGVFPKDVLIATFSQIDSVRDVFLINSGFENCPIYVYECTNSVMSEVDYESMSDTLIHTENIKYYGETTLYFDINLVISYIKLTHILDGSTFYLEYDNVNKCISIPLGSTLGIYTLTALCSRPAYFRDQMVLNLPNGEHTDNISLSSISVLNKSRIMVIGDETSLGSLYMVPYDDSYRDIKIYIFSDISRDVYPYLVDMRSPIEGIDESVTVGNSAYDYTHTPLQHNEYISISKEIQEEFNENIYNSVSDKYVPTIYDFLSVNKNIWSNMYILDYYSLNVDIEYTYDVLIHNDLIIFTLTVLNPDARYSMYLKNTNIDYQNAFVKLTDLGNNVYVKSDDGIDDANTIIQQYNIMTFGYYPGFISYDSDGKPSTLTLELGFYDVYFNIYGSATTVELSIGDLSIPGTFWHGEYAEYEYSGNDDGEE